MKAYINDWIVRLVLDKMNVIFTGDSFRQVKFTIRLLNQLLETELVKVEKHISGGVVVDYTTQSR